MPVNLASVTRIVLSAAFALAACSNIPGSETPVINPTETQAIRSEAQGTSTASKLPSASATPTPAATQTPKASATPSLTEMPVKRGEVIGLTNFSELKPIYRLEEAPAKVTAVAFSPDGTKLAASTDDGNVKIWQAGDGKLLFTLTGHDEQVNSLAFSPDGKWLASASADETVRIWRAEDGSLERMIDTGMVGRAIRAEFSNDSKLIAIAGHLCFIMVRNVETGLLRRTMKQPHCLTKSGGVVEYWGLAFAPEGTWLMAGEGQPRGSGGSIQTWNYEEFAGPKLIRGYDLVIRDLSLSPDGTKMAVALSGSPEIWLLRAADGELIYALEGHTYRVNSVRYAADGGLIVSGGRDGSVRLWNPETGELVTTLQEHSAAVNSVAISQDGSLIAAGADDGRVIVWGIGQR